MTQTWASSSGRRENIRKKRSCLHVRKQQFLLLHWVWMNHCVEYFRILTGREVRSWAAPRKPKAGAADITQKAAADPAVPVSEVNVPVPSQLMPTVPSRSADDPVIPAMKGEEMDEFIWRVGSTMFQIDLGPHRASHP